MGVLVSILIQRMVQLKERRARAVVREGGEAQGGGVLLTLVVVGGGERIAQDANQAKHDRFGTNSKRRWHLDRVSMLVQIRHLWHRREKPVECGGGMPHEHQKGRSPS